MATRTGRNVTIGIAAAVLAVAALMLWTQRPQPIPDASVSAVNAPADDRAASVTDTKTPSADASAPVATVGEEAAQEAGSAAAEADEPQADESLATPAFDEVRQDADGMTVIAGRAAPGSRVTLLQNGSEVATATADSSGKFATIAILPPDGKGHVLSLLQDQGGTQIGSADQVILAPSQPTGTAAEPAQDNVQSETIAVATEAKEARDTPATNDPAAPVDARDQVTPTEQAAAAQANGSADRLAETVEAQGPATVDAAEDGATIATGVTQDAADTGTPDPAQVADTAPLAPEAPQPIANAVPDTPQQVAVLKSTADGVELLQPATPQVMTNVSLDTISYSELGEVRLAGRAQSDAVQIRVYLDNDAVISLPVDDKGRWRGDVPDIDEGVYTLRIDEVNAEGDVTSRVETPFKRESAEILAAASDGAGGPISAITVQKGATLWAIARDRYGDGLLYVRVFEANKDDIRDPDLIYPGQVFDLPN
jgi:nucleoid-associated protein YgaU